MTPATRLLHVVPQSVKFIDWKQINWDQVRRTYYWMYQQFSYRYPGPIRDLHQRLVVVPPARHGDQYLYAHKVHVTAAEMSLDSRSDDFGNMIYYLDLPHVDGSVDFEVWSSVERSNQTEHLPVLTHEEAAIYVKPSPLTQPDNRIIDAALELGREEPDVWKLAERINTWVWQIMKYTSGVTNVATTAAQALALSQGLCQDYSHIMIAICRVLGIPARYVSGHMLGEGGSHAWVEVMLPNPHGPNLVAVAFDPTNHCRAKLKHITIAVGRDYSDVSPTSGYFTAPYRGVLTSSKRVGLLSVEYFDGAILSFDDSELVFLDDEKRIA